MDMDTFDPVVFAPENIPESLQEQDCWLVSKDKFPCNSAGDPLKEWSNPDNLISFSTAVSRAKSENHDISLSITPVNIAALDFDHCLSGTVFVNEEAEQLIHKIKEKVPNIFIERSKSGEGLHIFLKPNPEKFPTFTNSIGKGLYHFDKGANIKLEVFYKTKNRHFVMTGDISLNPDGNYIPKGEEADEILLMVYEMCQKQCQSSNTTKTVSSSTKDITRNNNSNVIYKDPPEYTHDLANWLLDQIDPNAIAGDDTAFTAICSAYKVVTDDYEYFDEWCSQDTTLNKDGKPRYNPKNNIDRWNSFKDTNFGINTLIGKARQLNPNLDIKTFKRQWYKEHPEHSNKNITVDDSSDVAKSPVVSVVTPDNLLGGDTSDGDNALRILYFAKGKLGYVPETQQFAIFKSKDFIDKDTGEIIAVGGKWIFGDSSILKPLVHELRKCLTPRAETETELAIIKSLKTNRKVKDAIAMLAGMQECFIHIYEFDRHSTYLNCANGVVDLENGMLLKATPELRLTQQTPVIYDPEACTCEDFDKFIVEVLPDEDDRKGFIRFVGYCMTGLNCEHKALFIVGSGRNGKSTVLNIINRLLGDYATTYSIHALLQTYKQKTGEEASPLKAKLVGKRFVMVNEIPKNRKLDMTEFKHMTGGDPFTYRRLHCDETTCEYPQHKFILGGNNLPEIEDVTDNALIDRLCVVNFPCYFGDRPDTGLLTRLTTNKALTGILNTFVQSAINYLKEGLYQSEGMKQALQSYVEENSYVAEYLECYTQQSDKGSILIADLLTRIQFEYGSMASSLTKQGLRKQLESLGYNVTHGNKGNEIKGRSFRA